MCLFGNHLLQGHRPNVVPRSPSPLFTSLGCAISVLVSNGVKSQTSISWDFCAEGPSMIKKLYGAYHMGGFSCCQINSPSGEKYKITLFFFHIKYFTSNITWNYFDIKKSIFLKLSLFQCWVQCWLKLCRAIMCKDKNKFNILVFTHTIFAGGYLYYSPALVNKTV